MYCIVKNLTMKLTLESFNLIYYVDIKISKKNKNPLALDEIF